MALQDKELPCSIRLRVHLWFWLIPGFSEDTVKSHTCSTPVWGLTSGYLAVGPGKPGFTFFKICLLLLVVTILGTLILPNLVLNYVSVCVHSRTQWLAKNSPPVFKYNENRELPTAGRRRACCPSFLSFALQLPGGRGEEEEDRGEEGTFEVFACARPKCTTYSFSPSLLQSCCAISSPFSFTVGWKQNSSSTLSAVPLAKPPTWLTLDKCLSFFTARSSHSELPLLQIPFRRWKGEDLGCAAAAWAPGGTVTPIII